MFTQKFRASQFYINAISVVISYSMNAAGCLTVGEVGKCEHADLQRFKDCGGVCDGWVTGG